MKKIRDLDFFESRSERPQLKVYAILKRERNERSLLRSPQNFSWPPRSKRVWPTPAQRGKEDKR